MPRRDLRLEALVDIMKGKIKVHAHSYREDEIMMLMRVAEDFGFRIKTFQHVLEGYKVADEMAKHGAVRIHVRRQVGLQDGSLGRDPVQHGAHGASRCRRVDQLGLAMSACVACTRKRPSR